MHIFIRLLILALVLAMLPCAVSAHPLDMYGFGSRATAMGGAFAAVADDYSAIYYNIGGLAQVEGNTLTAGFMVQKPYLNLDLHPAPYTSKSDANYLHELGKSQADVEDVNGYFFGIVAKPHRLIAVGAGIYLPEGLVARVKPLDAHLPTFALHDNRSQRVVTMVGGSIRVLPTLCVGGGIRLFLKAQGYLDLPVELKQENLELRQGERPAEPIEPEAELVLDLPLTTYPFFGVHYQPTENLRFGASYQAEYSLEVDMDAGIELVIRNYTIDLADLDQIAPDLLPIRTTIELNIPALGDHPLKVPVVLEGLEGEISIDASIPLNLALSMADLWKPQSANFGVAYDPIDALTLSADVVWYDWSQFPSPDMDIDIDDITINLQTLPATVQGRIQSLSIPVLGTIGPLPPVSIELPGLDTSLTIPLDFAEPTPVTTHDIFEPHFGFEYRFPTVQSFWWTGDLDVAIRGGYIFSPSPFKADKGWANMVSPDTHIFSTGTGFTFNRFFTLDFYGQYHYLTPITVQKDVIDPDMPFDEFTAKGHIFGGGFSATVKW